MSEEKRDVNAERVYYKYADIEAEWKKSKDKKPITLVEDALYIEKTPNNFNPDKFDFVFEKDGKNHILNHAGHLSYLMSKLEPGAFVDVQYTGKVKLEKGTYAGKESHNFKVFVSSKSPIEEVMKTKETSSDIEVPF